MDAEKFESQFRETTSTYFADRNEYKTVHVLITYWIENDLGLEEELESLRKIFEDDYHFAVTTFPIPLEGSQRRLNTEISNFIDKWSQELDSLVIIYYAGHCFRSEKGEACWAAFEKGDPTLYWSACQQNLFGADGDVLLILDCCEATVVSKGSKQRGRFEVLAASAKGRPTPAPSKVSFTRFLMRELRKRKDKGVTARELSGLLWEQDSIRETPFWGDLARTSPSAGNISIQPLRQPQELGFMKKPSSFVLFKASLTNDVTGSQISKWLKTAPPESVTAVDIEAVVLKAVNIQQRMPSGAFPTNSIFRKLSEPVQQDILRQFHGLNTAMESSRATAEDPLSQGDNVQTSRAYNSIGNHVSTLCNTVETRLLLDLSPEDLEEALHDDGAIATGAVESINLRQMLLQMAAIPDDLGIPREKIAFTDREHRFRAGKISCKSVLVELFSYEVDERTEEPTGAALDQVKKITALLRQPKRTSFHILPCVGYVQDKMDHKLGLVFETPHHRELNGPPTMLVDLYKHKPYTSLSDRLRLAHALAVAVENFHRVGWVHKELRSNNVCFLSPRKEEDHARSPADDLDLSSPWLFGFDYARAIDAGTRLDEDQSLENNVYRHPDRWGRPNVKFTKVHDVYSLGVVLFEVANWKDVRSVIKLGKHISTSDVRKGIDKKCSEKLPFMVGQVFTNAIKACLDFETPTQGKNEYEVQRHFQEEILSPLEKVVGRI